jgi:glycosyltransferase involved in cell wall biosynthesis
MSITVITINYNNCAGLRRTVESVVGQKTTVNEFIVIDGGSTDGSTDVINAYADRISYWVSEKDRGIYHAMNKGVARAHGDYCFFLNSGDVFYDNTVLDRVSKSVLDKDIIIGKVVIDGSEELMSPPPSREISLYHLYSRAIPHQGSFIRTALLRQHPYDESLRIASDWKFFVQAIIMDNCSLKYTEEFVARYDTNGVSSVNPELMREEKGRVLEELFPPRLLADYQYMKSSECLTQQLLPELRQNYGIDKIMYRIGLLLLKLRRK